MESRVQGAPDLQIVVATAFPHFSEKSDAYQYGFDTHKILRGRYSRLEQASPVHTLQFAPAVVNGVLSRIPNLPSRAAAALVAVLAGTVDIPNRLSLGLSDPGRFEDNHMAAGTTTKFRTSREVVSVLDAVGSTDNADAGFKAQVAEEMARWKEAMVDCVYHNSLVEKESPASVAVAGLAVACAWVASMRGYPLPAGAAALHWRTYGEADARMVAEGAFGAFNEPSAQLHAAWKRHGIAEGFARAVFREVSRGVASALAPVFAKGVALCGERVVLAAAARAAALVVATSEYLVVRTEPMLIMLAEPQNERKRKRASDSHATLPILCGFASNVIDMCKDLATHPTRADVVKWACATHTALEPLVQMYMPHASAGHEGMPFERQPLVNLCAAIVSNSPQPLRNDPLLAKWYTLACQTISRLRLVKVPTVEEEQRTNTASQLDERREARFVATETAHRVLVERSNFQQSWADALGAGWCVLFERYAAARDAVKRSETGGSATTKESDGCAAARIDKRSMTEGNESATRMWAVANVSYVTMRYVVLGEPPYFLAAAPLDAKVVVAFQENGQGGVRQEKRMVTWATAYPASFA